VTRLRCCVRILQIETVLSATGQLRPPDNCRVANWPPRVGKQLAYAFHGANAMPQD
jgi:hypothetical protein